MDVRIIDAGNDLRCQSQLIGDFKSIIVHEETKTTIPSQTPYKFSNYSFISTPIFIDKKDIPNYQKHLQTCLKNRKARKKKRKK